MTSVWTSDEESIKHPEGTGRKLHPALVHNGEGPDGHKDITEAYEETVKMTDVVTEDTSVT